MEETVKLITEMVNSVGFPIVACCVMFWQNDKMGKLLNEVSTNVRLLNEKINDMEDKISK